MTTEALPGFERGYVKGRYGQIHYMIGGNAEGGQPPLVLLHQNPSSVLEYRAFAAEMGKDRRVVAFDTPGNGMSDRPPEPLTMEGYAASFSEALDALDAASWGKADVFGYHTGTYLSTELAIARPDLIGRVILSGIPYRTAEQRAERLEKAKNPAPLDDGGEEVFSHLRWLWDWTVRDRDPKTPIENSVELFVEKLRPMQRASWPYVGVWSYDAPARLPLVTQPVLILQPHEPLLEYTKEAAKLLSKVEMVEYPHLNHDVFEAGVQDFAKAIRAWKA